MEKIKRNRRKLKDIAKDMIEINKRKPSEDEIDELMEIINNSQIPSEEENEERKIAIKRNEDSVEQTWV